MASVIAYLDPNHIAIALNTMKNAAQGKSVLGCESGDLRITACLSMAIRTVSQMLPVDFQKGERL